MGLARRPLRRRRHVRALVREVRLAHGIRQPPQLPPLQHAPGKQVGQVPGVLVHCAPRDPPISPGRNAFHIRVHGHDAAERVVGCSAQRQRVAAPFLQGLDVGMGHRLSAASPARAHLAADHDARSGAQPLRQRRPVVEPEEHQVAALVVAQAHFQAAAAPRAHLVDPSDGPGDHAAFAERSFRDRAALAPVLVAARQVEEQVLDGAETLAAQLLAQGGADAAQVLDGGKERVRGQPGLLSGSGDSGAAGMGGGAAGRGRRRVRRRGRLRGRGLVRA